jgi:outer membrane lipoprotein SlyB
MAKIRNKNTGAVKILSREVADSNLEGFPDIYEEIPEASISSRPPTNLEKAKDMFQGALETSRDTLMGAGQGLTLNLIDEFSARTGQAIDAVGARDVLERLGVKDIGPKLPKQGETPLTYEDYAKYQQDLVDQAKKRSPVGFTGGEIIGDIAGPGKLVKAAKGAKLAARVVESAIKTGALGAVSGFGASKERMSENPEALLLDTSITGLASGVLGAGGQVAAEAVTKAAPKFKDLARYLTKKEISGGAPVPPGVLPNDFLDEVLTKKVLDADPAKTQQALSGRHSELEVKRKILDKEAIKAAKEQGIDLPTYKKVRENLAQQEEYLSHLSPENPKVVFPPLSEELAARSGKLGEVGKNLQEVSSKQGQYTEAEKLVRAAMNREKEEAVKTASSPVLNILNKVIKSPMKSSIGATIGAYVGGTPGALIGGLAGNAINKRAQVPLAYSSRKLADVIERNPEAFQKWMPVLSSAAARGEKALSVADYLLQSRDPEYRRVSKEMNKEESDE